MFSKEEKLVVIINGKGTAGKDTLCEHYVSEYNAINISAIDPVLPVATLAGWDGVKDEKGRKLLANLKQAMVAYNDGPYKYICEQIHMFVVSKEANVLFIHIREAEEIQKVIEYAVDFVQVRSVLVYGREEAEQVTWNNPADDNVNNFDYDLQFCNDKLMDESCACFVSTIQYMRGVSDAR